MKIISRRWIMMAVIATTLMFVGCGSELMVVEMINGRTVEMKGDHLSMSGTATDMVEVIDGRVYFTLDDTDITEYCSETTYFRYDLKDEQGISHVFLIGGELDSVGWTEILFLKNGKRVSHSDVITEDGNEPAWYVTGNADVNKDYGYVPKNNDSSYSYETEIEPELDEN